MAEISSNINKKSPKRGEIWLVNLEPTLGSEIKKIRPVVIINSDAIGKLPLRLIAPITDWKTHFNRNPWHIKIKPDDINNLTKLSAVDTLQLRGVDLIRFQKKIGNLSPENMTAITLAIITIIEADLTEI